MAAVSEAASGSSRVSSVVFESTLDRRLQGLTNTMESIQGLSTWCIENKKYHSIIVRSWLKWLKKHASQRLNLFYLANDVIQNCKRKNAVVYRTTFTDVLPEAIKLINTLKDSKVRKCVDRILCIWEERNVYSEEFISRLRSGLTQQDEPPAPANPKAALRSKIVAEFVPSSFIEHLTKYRSSIDEIDLREKQLAAMRVDVCSTVALKKLKDKAGGKRFSKDFEDGSAKLQDFVTFLNGEVQKGPAFIEALENADIFYEMQYKEVKIVTNAYQTFANRVLHLKRKLDALKASLPDPDDSPIPSPSEDAPSPTGSESPFHSLPQNNSPDPELEGQVMEEDLIALVDAPSPLSSPGDRDNRDVEDMELSDVEDTVGPSIIVEERSEQPDPASLSTETPVMEASQSIHAAPEKENTSSAATGISTTSSLPINLAGVDLGKISSIISTLTNVMKSNAAGVSPVSHSSATTQSTTQVSAASPSLKSPTVSSSQSVPTSSSLASVLSRVDINPSTLLSVLSKTQTQGAGYQAAGVSPVSNSSATTQSTTQVSAASPSLKSPTVSSSQSVPTSSSLASVLSRVDINPSTLLSVLSKTQTQGAGYQGLSSFLNGQTGTTSTHSGSDVNPFPDPALTAYTHPSPKTTLVPFAFPPVQAGDSTPQGNVTLQSSQSFEIVPTMEEQEVEKEKDHLTSLSSTLDSKIDSFLQVNPGLRGFNLDFPSVFSWSKAVSSPSASTENQGGTPVRDESGATPTQDEVMDDPVVQPFMPQGGPLQTSKTSALAAETASPVLPNYTNTSWYEQNRLGLQYGSESQSGGQNYKKDLTVKSNLQSSVPPLADMGHLQHVDSLLPSLASNKQLSTKITDTINQIAQATPFSASKGMEPATAANDDWYSNTYGNGQEQHVSARCDSYGENQHCSQDPRHVLNPHRFFNTPLPPPPPIPQLPPPPQDLFPPVAGGVKNPVELSDTVDKVQASDIPAYVPGNVANFDYDERLSNQAKEPFHSHLNASGSQHCGVTQRPALLVPQNGPMNYIIRPRVPVNQYRNPSMPPPGRPVPFLAGRGFGEPRRCRPFHEPPNRPQAPHREPYLGQLCDAPHCSPTSSPQPPHDIEPSHSPQSHTFYAEKRPLLPRHPEHGLPSHIEHRPPSPQHYRAPSPGHFPPQRPLRHPHMPHPREPPFQRGKRPGSPFGGSPRLAGQFYPTKRPFLPPRY